MPAGTLITYNNVDASATGGLYFLPPVPANLTGWFDIGGSAAASIINRARGGVGGGAVVGAPTFAPAYASLKGNTNYIQTGVADVASFTAMVAVRSSDTFAAAATRPVVLSCYASTGATGGFSMSGSGTAGAPQLTMATLVAYNNGTNDTSLNRTVAIADFSVWNLLLLSFDAATGTETVINLTTGASTSTAWAGTNPARVLATNAIRIGASYDAGLLQGSMDVSLAAMWSRALTTTERSTMYAFIKSLLLARKGITI